MSMPGAPDRRRRPGPTRGLAARAAPAALLLALAAATGWAQALPELREPVTDTAGVIDAASAAAMDRLIRALEAASGDVVVVATVATVAPFADTREYAVKLFENGGRGIGKKGRDNGLLVLLAVKERQVRIEVGYDLESIITDGYAGETSRDAMVPYFRQGEYGQGLLAGVRRLVGRIADARGVAIAEAPVTPTRASRRSPPSFLVIFAIYLAFVVIRRMAGFGSRGRRGKWGGGGWSGWSGGVGGFGGSSGGFGGGFGGFGGGGGGGGFGGFGGGRSGGGGGGASW